MVVDTLGMVLNCFVSAANTADVKGAKAALAPVLEEMVRIEKILADQSYKGELAKILEKAHPLDPEQLEPETQIKKLIATATSPRDKAFYQSLLQKARTESTNFQVASSPSVNSSEPKRANQQEKTESNTEKKPTSPVIFQAVGVIEGVVESKDNKLKVSIGESSYELRFVPGSKKKQFQMLKQEIEKQGSCLKTLIVYPQAHLNKKGSSKISLALSSVQTSEKLENHLDLRSGEFKLAGIWQYPPLGSTPCITIRRNWQQGLVNYLEKMESKQKANILDLL